MSIMSVVYFWLRENQTPYYVGYGSHKTRAYAAHPRKKETLFLNQKIQKIFILNTIQQNGED